MSALVGETVQMVTTGGFDSDGNWLPPRDIVEIPGCVITPKGTAVGAAADYFFSSADLSILAPVFIADIESDRQFLIRNEWYELDGVPFNHRSVFGTGAGGTEIPVKRVKAT